MEMFRHRVTATLDPMGEFEGRKVLITGGGSGIGLATAQRLVEAGAHVVITGRDAARLEAAAKTIGSDRVRTVPADVSQVAELDRLMGEVRQAYGQLDGLFVNAGVGLVAPGAAVSEADFDRVVGTNFKGAYFTVSRAMPLLADGASVVLNSSWTVQRGLGIGSLYPASKAAVLNLAGSFAAELAGRGIRVNSVTPGHIGTHMFAGLTGGSEQVAEMFRSQVALGRIGEPGEVSDAVLFLLSPRSAYVTGQDLVVDGGLLGSVPLAPMPS
jgi:NAD(P)-dependent dehydrogenase (short-subunit alcohol dehydrogenase family)